MKQNFIYINLNQYATRAQITAKKEEMTKWIIFSLIAVSLLTVLTLEIIVTQNITSLVNKRENTIPRRKRDNEHTIP